MNISKLKIGPKRSDAQYWSGFGFDVVTLEHCAQLPITDGLDSKLTTVDGKSSCDQSATIEICGSLPAGYLALVAIGTAALILLRQILQSLGVPPQLVLRPNDDLTCYIYKASERLPEALSADDLPDGVSILTGGATIKLPTGERCTRDNYGVTKLDELPELVEAEHAEPISDEPDAATGPQTVMRNNPLEAYSMRGEADNMASRAQAPTPLLGDLVLSGQSTVLYAPPNGGKTLISLALLVEAVVAGRIAGANVYFFNADDSGSGIATKMRILDDLGVHTLVPGFKGLKAAAMLGLLQDCVRNDKCAGVLVILDTLKKCVSLMDKAQSAAFADVCRQFTVKGGTVLAIAHTRKNPTASGNLTYGGTTDIVEDFDAACLIVPQQMTGDAGERLVTFNFTKRRGDNAEGATYAFAAETGITYEERLASVHLVDVDQIDSLKRVTREQTDGDLIAIVTDLIANGVTQKMQLRNAVSAAAGISTRSAVRLLDRYTGSDPTVDRWRFSVKAHGAKVYELLTQPEPAPAPPPS